MQLLVVSCLMLAACEQAPPAAESHAQPVAAITQVAEQSLEQSAKKQLATKEQGGKSTTEVPPAPSWPAFEPPFGDRVELFAPPQQDTSSAPKNRPDADQVVLRGFVNVGQRRVVLQIGDIVAPLAVDEQRHGVRVLSIDPPQAVLERGRQRWTVTLPNDASND